MKVVQINTVCGTGSVGKIAANLSRGSLNHEIESIVAYGRGHGMENVPGYKIGSIIDFSSHVLLGLIKGRGGFGSKYTTMKFIQWLEEVQPDIIHLHNIHGFYLHIDLLFSYIKRKKIPVVWTLHDCWPFTGHCSYFDYYNCQKWKTHCDTCSRHRRTYPYVMGYDSSKRNYRDKKEIFNQVPNMMLVTPSKWLTNLVGESFLKKYPVKVIPNGIDLNLFNIDSTMKKELYLILGVANIWEPRKGIKYFYELAEILDDVFKIVLIGVNDRQLRYINKHYKDKILGIKKTKNQQELASWYQKAGCYINPTLEDNFPTTNLEALACGTPVITFRTGGSVECIDDTCGRVVDKEDVQGLRNCILELMHDTEVNSESCNKKAQQYSMERFEGSYFELYSKMVIKV